MARLSLHYEINSDGIILHFLARDVEGSEKPLFAAVRFSGDDLRGLGAADIVPVVAKALNDGLQKIEQHVTITLTKKDL